MSFKTLVETFGDLSMAKNVNTTSPFDFQEFTVLAVPEKMMPEISAQAEQPEGVTLDLPEISKTTDIEVPKEPSKQFKGEHKHLSTEDLQILIQWVDQQSKADTVPPEARAQLLEWYKDLVTELNQRSDDSVKKD